MYALVLPPAVVVIFLIILKKCKTIRRKQFSLGYQHFSKHYNNEIKKEKNEIFSEMRNIKSFDPELRERGVIRILELGAGPGNNFQFYPENSRLIVIEPNEYFDNRRARNLARYQTIRMEKLIHGFGEDMSAIKDNSVDAVVATFVLCSVKSVDKVLQEIHRVLAPGKKYYFFEHGIGRRSDWQWRMQNFLNPVWKIVCDGCELTKDTGKDIRNCGLFINVQYKRFRTSKSSSIAGKCIGDSAYGTAQKVATLLSNKIE
ncbi:hypothetical protein CHUAL_008265 [Chamberlinius hualienensis]